MMALKSFVYFTSTGIMFLRLQHYFETKQYVLQCIEQSLNIA